MQDYRSESYARRAKSVARSGGYDKKEPTTTFTAQSGNTTITTDSPTAQVLTEDGFKPISSVGKVVSSPTLQASNAGQVKSDSYRAITAQKLAMQETMPGVNAPGRNPFTDQRVSKVSGPVAQRLAADRGMSVRGDTYQLVVSRRPVKGAPGMSMKPDAPPARKRELNKELLNPTMRFRKLRSEFQEFQKNKDVGVGTKTAGVVIGGLGVGVAFVGAVGQESVKQLVLDQFSTDEKGGLTVTPDFLIGTWTGLRTGIGSGRTQINVGDPVKFKAEYEGFLKRENIKPGSLITQDDALKIQEFFLKYDRENVATSVVKRGSTQVKTTPGASSGGREVGVELALRPVEEGALIGKTRQLGGGVSAKTEYLVLKKGKAELVNPKDLNNFDFVEVSGSKTTRSSEPRLVRPDQDFKKLAEPGSNLAKLPGGNLGALSSDVRPGAKVSRGFKSLVSTSEFEGVLGTKGGGVRTKDFVKIIDFLDLPNAKVLRARTVSKGNTAPLGSGSSEDAYFKIRGVDTKRTGSSDAVTGKLRIGREKKSKYNPNQIEDQRFRLEYFDKKALTASNIKEVVEFETGYYVKVYTFDNNIRAFKNVELFVPKAGKVAAGFAGGVSANRANTPSTPTESSGDIGLANGDGTVLVSKTKVKTEGGLVSIQAEPQTKSKTKSKAKTEMPKTEFKSAGAPGDFRVFEKAGRSGNPVGAYYSKENTLNKVVGRGKSRGFALFRSNTRSDIGQGSGGMGGVASLPGLRVGQSNSQASRAASAVSVGVSSAQVQGQRQSTASGFDTQAFRSPYQRLKDPVDTPKSKNPKFKLPDFKNGNERSLFSVDVRRRGSFRTIGKGLNLQQAVSLGAGVARNTAARTFRVRQGSRVVPVNAGSGFYTKGGLNIEASKFALKSQGEFREITLKGVRMRSGRGVF